MCWLDQCLAVNGVPGSQQPRIRGQSVDMDSLAVTSLEKKYKPEV